MEPQEIEYEQTEPQDEPLHHSRYAVLIRKKVINLAICFGIFFLTGFIEAPKIIKATLSLFKLQDVTISTSSPFQLLSLSTNIATIIGGTAFFLLFIFYTYDFMKDGLHKKEKRVFFVLLLAGILLFVVGVLYGFFILYVYLESVAKINLAMGVQNIWDINEFLSQMILTSVFLGAVFQFPIILTFLIRMNILTVRILKQKRKIAFICIFLFVGFLPPPDIFSTFIEAFPLIILYEIAIQANRSYDRSRHEEIEAVI